MDDGTLFPKRKSFTNMRFKNNIFYGTIDWYGVEGVTVGGESQWIYEMHFSDNYKYIKKGTCKVIGIRGEEIVTYNFGIVEGDLQYELFE